MQIDATILAVLKAFVKQSGGSSGSGQGAKEIELQKSDTAIQWRYVGDLEWTDLVQLSELKGDPGNTGAMANLTMGTVTTLNAGSSATASVESNPDGSGYVLNLGIPEGEAGEDGGDNINVDAEMKEYMNTVKPNIKQAIINKGGSVQDTDSFGDYATRISEIPNGIYAAEDLPQQTVLTATYSSTSPSGIILNFTDVSASGYLIVRKTGSKPKTSADGTIVYDGVYATDILDSDVVVGNVYYYRIFPRNSKNQYQSLEGQSITVCDYKSRDGQKQAKDLALDESVSFGYYNNQVFKWKVVDTQDSSGPMMAADQNCSNKQFDSPENDSTNPNPITARKSNGNNRWAYSNIRQWLNSDGESGAWYIAQHDYDVAPNYKTEAGFLNGFTEAEKNAIVVRTNTCILDMNDGGGTETVQDMIWFPSSCEAGKEISSEGYKFEKYDGTNASAVYQSNWWLRTINNALGMAETACLVRCVGSGGNLYGNNANYIYAARPFCQLRCDTWLTWSESLDSYVLADDSQRTWEA